MKRTLFILILLIFSKTEASTSLTGSIENLNPADQILITIPFDCWYYKDTSVEINADEKGNFSTAFKITKPQNIFLHINSQKLLIYAEPGKNISLNADALNLINSLNFLGELSKENNFRNESGLLFSSLQPTKLDYNSASLDAILNHIDSSKIYFQEELRYGDYSEDFKKLTASDLQYVKHTILWNLIIGDRKVLNEDRDSWTTALKEAHLNNPINNKEAIESHFYQTVLAYFPRYLHITSTETELAQKVKNIMGKNFDEALKEIKAKGERFWEFQVYTHYFTEEVLEKLLASFIENGVRYGKLDYLNETYFYYLENFPDSPFRNYIDELMAPVIELENAPTTSFETTNNSNDTFLEIISKHKGKVVLVDLWGSWCGPCKKEFSYNQALKKKFQKEPVDFVYIAFEYNRTNPEKIWKKTANFYKLEGRHILADDGLKKNIELLYGSPDRKYFPRYILVDKNGKIADLTAAKPSSGEVLYQQIENLLK